MPHPFIRFLLGIAAVILPSLLALAADDTIQQCKPGPWGRIEYRTIYLEAPEWLIEKFPLPGTQPRFCFASADEEEVRRFLTEAGVETAMVSRWLDDPRCQVLDGFLATFPSATDVESLSGRARSIIYPELAKVPLNEFFHDPIFVSGSSVEEWLRGSSMPPEIVALIAKLTYLEGDALIFSNLSTLISHAQSEAEARSWLKDITRTKALIASLRIGPDDDIKAVAEYWTAGRRRKDMLPLLESIAHTPDGGQLDLMHLLPAQARKLLYTYPSPDMALLGQNTNCHWTSLNFFNFAAQNIYLDLKLAATGVLANYSPIPTAAELGDVIFFLDAGGDAFHSCVYVADNLVYTKNGDNPIAPWILTTIEDVKQVYLRKPGAKIAAFRLNESRKSGSLPRITDSRKRASNR
ncbi:MAG: hypothetical protein ABMA13_18570 [Chthoniobacteraceae bacterium]